MGGPFSRPAQGVRIRMGLPCRPRHQELLEELGGVRGCVDVVPPSDGLRHEDGVIEAQIIGGRIHMEPAAVYMKLNALA